ncbi:hypothetical protein [Lacrimispora brassicae]
MVFGADVIITADVIVTITAAVILIIIATIIADVIAKKKKTNAKRKEEKLIVQVFGMAATVLPVGATMMIADAINAGKEISMQET